MKKEKTKWSSPELKELDVSETLGGIPSSLPEGTIVTNPDGSEILGFFGS